MTSSDDMLYCYLIDIVSHLQPLSHRCQLSFNGRKLQEVTEERDLGIYVTDDLKPSVQCAKAAVKAMQVLGVIKRNFVLTDEEDFRLFV